MAENIASLGYGISYVRIILTLLCIAYGYPLRSVCSFRSEHAVGVNMVLC